MDNQTIFQQPAPTPPAKKPFYKKWWFIILVVLAVFLVIALAAGGDADPQQQENGSQTNSTDTNSTSGSSANTYEKVDLQTMLDELESNALRAEQKYQNKNVEITGKIASFDSDGAYISIEPVNADEWNFDTVMCYIKNQSQTDFLLEKSKGDTVTIKGKITQIGEFLGYSIDIAEIK